MRIILLIMSSLLVLVPAVANAANNKEAKAGAVTSKGQDAILEQAADKGDKASTEAVANKEEAITFENVWARPTMLPSNNSAVYMLIKNNTDEDIELIGASAPAEANDVELHNSSVDEKGVAKMTALDKVVIPAQGEVEFKPNGMHIMLKDLSHTMVIGDKFTVELKFKDRPSQTVEAVIQSKH